MSLILKPLKKTQLGCLRQVLTERIRESNIEKRSTVDFCFSGMDRGYDGKYMGAYVDDAAEPTVALVMSHFPGMATFNLLAFINLIYVKPERRGDPKVLEVLLRTAENYAKLNGADTLVGSSWLYRGSEDSSKMWERNGFEIQEKIYIKHLEEGK